MPAMIPRLGLLWLVSLLPAATPGLAADDRPEDLRIGQKVANFRLPTANGREFALFDLAGKKAAVLVFTGTQCPVGNLYLPRLVELAGAYEKQGVAFVAINSNASESLADLAAHAREHALPFPVLRDADRRVADALGVDRTCAAIVLDGQAILRYRGAIDDQYVPGARKPAPTANYLREALDAVLAGRPVAVVATPVAGCPIEGTAALSPKAQDDAPKAARVRAPSSEIRDALTARELGPVIPGEDDRPPAPPDDVTYSRDVAPILQAKCQSCHRPGQVGPFSLLSYDDARRRASGIAEVVEQRRMPPWHADPRIGHFRNDRSLSNLERQTLLAWVEQGAPLGDPAALPAPRSFPSEWAIGTPDAIIPIPKPLEVPASGVVDYINVDVPTGFTEDRWVRAAEVLPTERSVVHHVIAFVVTKDARGRERKDHFAAYVPGDIPTIYPAGVAKRIPAGATISFQIHYTPTGTAKIDQSRLGLVFADGPPEHEAHTRHVTNPRFRIPPGDPNHEVASTWTVPRDIHLISLSPHMHLRGKDFRYTATFPDGRIEPLLSVPAYDFGWQSVYLLNEPIALPKGTRIDCVAHFDNSKANPNNPDPTAEVRWGEQSWQEMMMGYLDYSDDAPVARP